jgi:hypothetical protein
MDATADLRLCAAWRTLFGPGPDAPPLSTLSPPALRRAWRQQALRTHPDRVTDPAGKRRATEEFIEASRAYELLASFVSAGPPRRAARAAARPSPQAHARPRPPGEPARRRPRAAAGAGFPRRRLRLGEFLYRSRVITFESLIAALLWQRRQRERFGEICQRWGLLGPVEAALLLERRTPGEPVGRTARRLRLLTEAEVGAVLSFQRRRQRPLGEYFLEQGLLTRLALRALLARHDAHNAACPRSRAHR